MSTERRHRIGTIGNVAQVEREMNDDMCIEKRRPAFTGSIIDLISS